MRPIHWPIRLRSVHRICAAPRQPSWIWCELFATTQNHQIAQTLNDRWLRTGTAQPAAKLHVKRLTLQFYQLPVKKGTRYDYILIDKSLHKLVDRSVSVARPKDSNMQAITKPLR